MHTSNYIQLEKCVSSSWSTNRLTSDMIFYLIISVVTGHRLFRSLQKPSSRQGCWNKYFQQKQLHSEENFNTHHPYGMYNKWSKPQMAICWSSSRSFPATDSSSSCRKVWFLQWITRDAPRNPSWSKTLERSRPTVMDRQMTIMLITNSIPDSTSFFMIISMPCEYQELPRHLN